MHFVENLEFVIVREDCLFREALVALDRNGLQILLVTDECNVLIGIVTDGDVRRYILQDQSIDMPISGIANRNFVALTEERRNEAIDIFSTAQFMHLPIVNKQGQVVSLAINTEMKQPQIDGGELPVVIMAGGKGTRLLPLTRIIPKPLIPVGDKTMIERIMDGLSSQGFNDFRIIINYKKELIKSYLSEVQTSYKVSFIEEPEYLGTVGGLAMLKQDLSGPFLLTNCDVIAKLNYKALLDWHIEHDAQLTILGVRKRTDIPYGVVTVNDSYYVVEVNEKPYYNHLIISGIYVMDSSVLDLIPSGRNFGMDDLLRVLLSQDLKVACYPIENEWFDMGQFKEYRKLIQHLGGVDV